MESYINKCIFIAMKRKFNLTILGKAVCKFLHIFFSNDKTQTTKENKEHQKLMYLTQHNQIEFMSVWD